MDSASEQSSLFHGSDLLRTVHPRPLGTYRVSVPSLPPGAAYEWAGSNGEQTNQVMGNGGGFGGRRSFGLPFPFV